MTTKDTWFEWQSERFGWEKAPVAANIVLVIFFVELAVAVYNVSIPYFIGSGVLLLVYFLVKGRGISEYEYIYTAGELDIVLIKNLSKRKLKETISEDKIRYIQSGVQEHVNPKIYAANMDKAATVVYMTERGEEAVVIEADKRLRDILRMDGRDRG